MAFPEDVVKDAWELVEGRCECTNTVHQHNGGRCNKHLSLEKRGKVGWGAWEACPVDDIKEHNSLSNCAILCWDCQNR